MLNRRAVLAGLAAVSAAPALSSAAACCPVDPVGEVYDVTGVSGQSARVGSLAEAVAIVTLWSEHKPGLPCSGDAYTIRRVDFV